MLRLIVFLVLVGGLYVMWDRGMFDGTGPTSSSPRAGATGEGPAERAGAVIDQAIAKAGRAVQHAGHSVEHAAEGGTPRDTRDDVR